MIRKFPLNKARHKNGYKGGKKDIAYFVRPLKSRDFVVTQSYSSLKVWKIQRN